MMIETTVIEEALVIIMGQLMQYQANESFRTLSNGFQYSTLFRPEFGCAHVCANADSLAQRFFQSPELHLLSLIFVSVLGREIHLELIVRCAIHINNHV